MSLSIGERLKSAREAKGMTLDEAARATKVQRRILESLENDQIEDILDPAYGKIFLKKYAAFLGLNGAQLLEEYQTVQAPIEEPAVLLNRTSQKEQAVEVPPVVKVMVPAVLGLMAVIGVVFIGYLALDLFTGGKKKAVSVVVADAAPPAKPAVPTRVAAKTAQASKINLPRSKPLKLTIRSKEDVWLQVKSDGAVIFQNVLVQGTQESWTAKKELELWTGNAAAMELSLNGKPLENPIRGVKKGIRVTHSGLVLPE